MKLLVTVLIASQSPGSEVAISSSRSLVGISSSLIGFIIFGLLDEAHLPVGQLLPEVVDLLAVHVVAHGAQRLGDLGVAVLIALDGLAAGNRIYQPHSVVGRFHGVVAALGGLQRLMQSGHLPISSSW